MDFGPDRGFKSIFFARSKKPYQDVILQLQNLKFRFFVNFWRRIEKQILRGEKIAKLELRFEHFS